MVNSFFMNRRYEVTKDVEDFLLPQFEIVNVGSYNIGIQWKKDYKGEVKKKK
jgi:hypothetical protein